MTDKNKTCEGRLNPSTEKTSTQKWLESWVNNNSHNNPTKKWLKDGIAPAK